MRVKINKRQLAREVRDAVDDDMRERAERVAGSADRLHNKRTGYYSLQLDVRKRENWIAIANAYYAVWLEWGSRKMKGQRVMGRASDAARYSSNARDASR